jgi:hypothetical protein
MENQTVKNMKLIILEMNKQTRSEHVNYGALKTLSNSYQTLLRQLFTNPESISTIDDMNELEYQHKKLLELKDCLETQSIPELLSYGDYSSVNNITTTTTKLGDSISDINKLLIQYIYPKHRKLVGIFGVNINSAACMLDMLVDMSGEKMLENRSHLHNERSIVTKSISYIAREYGDSYRGRRFDEVYVDRNLDSERISALSLLVKDKNNVRYF